MAAPLATGVEDVVTATLQPDTFAAALAVVPLFGGLPASALAQLSGKLRRGRYTTGEAIVREGKSSDTLHVIVRGLVKVEVASPAGDGLVLAIQGEGDFFGEMGLLDGKPRSASVIALEPTETLILLRVEFLAFLHAYPQVTETILALLAQRIRELNTRVQEAFSLDLRGRLAQRLLQLGAERGHRVAEGLRVEVPLTQSELAGMVGASRQRVNAVLAEWQDQSIIRLERRGFTILQIEKLSLLVSY